MYTKRIDPANAVIASATAWDCVVASALARVPRRRVAVVVVGALRLTGGVRRRRVRR